MEYILLFFLAWMVVCLPAILFTAVANNRRRRENAQLYDKVTELTRQMERLMHRTQTEAFPKPPAVAAEPTVKVSAEEARTMTAPRPAPQPVPPREPVAEKPVPSIVAPTPARSPIPPPPKPAPPIAAQGQIEPRVAEMKPAEMKSQPAETKPQPELTSQPKRVEVGGIPLAPQAPLPAETSGVAPPPKPPSQPIAAPPAAPAERAPAAMSLPQPPMPGTASPSTQVRASSGSAGFSAHAAQDIQPPRKNGMSWEEGLGTNWLPRLGITAIVVGVGLLLSHFWGDFVAWQRVLILYAGALATLGCGIVAERNERYQTLGRALIGGGWAIIAAVTYAIGHRPAVLLVSSNALDLMLLLAVIGVMVWHTLKYNSQLVTGAAFLLGFAAITLNPDPPYHLIAGALLVGGMTVIVQRYRWWELEVFGILASYLNHFYWLFSIFGFEATRPHFEHGTTSVLLMAAYWALFRGSYVWRKVSSHEDESVSTIAGLLNPLLFLGVLKYQSFHPEWAFYALLILGAVEFVLGQLSVSRARRAPFYVLSSLGAAFMVAAVPFKYSGHSLEMLWLAGAEVFLLAGIFTRERLFRGFGLIVSGLIVLYTLPARAFPWLTEVMNGQPHHDVQLGIVLAVIAAVLYANSHLVRRRWAELFDHDLESASLTALSFVASCFAVGAVYALINDNAIAIVLALFVAALTLLGRQFDFSELVYQGHWISAVAIAQVIVVGRTLETSWAGIPERILTFVPVAGLLYLSSRYVRLSETSNKDVLSVAYTWAATALLALLVWFQSPDWCMPLLWIGLAIVLSLVGDALRRVDLKWHAFALVLLSFGRALVVNFDLVTTFHGLTYRLISVSLTAVGIYLLARWAPLRQIRPVYSATGTLLLAYLAYKETPEPWIPVAWISLAALLALAARLWKDRALLWETHILSFLAAGWTLYSSFAPQYRGGRVQLVSVAITAALLYGLNWITNIAEVIEDARMPHVYSWAGSLLLSWLLWYQVQPVSVSLTWGIFGLLLFELGNWRSWTFLRAQAYVALTCSFIHIFYANFNVLRAPGTFGPEVINVVLLVPIYFWIYWQLHGKKAASVIEGKIRIEYLLACLGTATLAALARFELPMDAVAVGYGAIIVATLLVAWRTRLQVFLYQALVMLGVAAFRLSMNNFYHLREPFSGLSTSIWTIALMAVGVPICLWIRRSNAEDASRTGWIHVLARHPEQPMFFVPFGLLTVLIWLKVTVGMVTLAWGAQAVLVFVLALWAKERTFRWAGLVLLLLCFVKIMAWDAWQFHDAKRFLTLIGVGVLALAVSSLILKNREALRQYL
jgi:hypothetical protein